MRQIGFIVGTGRCGSTVLAQVLNAHSAICVPHELQFVVSAGNGASLYDNYVRGELDRYSAADFIRVISERCPYNFEQYFDYIAHFNSLDYPQNDLRHLLIDLFSHICFAYNKEVFLEQTPWYGQCLDKLGKLFPEMKIVHIIRDGRDVALSFANTPWWSKDIVSNLYQWQREIARICEYGVNNRRNYIEVRYEDLVTAPNVELAKILQLFNLNFETDMLDRENLVDYRSFLKSGSMQYQSSQYAKWYDTNSGAVFFRESINKWKLHKEFDFSEIPLSIKQTLSQFQYDA